MRIKIKRQVTVNASASKSWQVVAHDFDEIERWSSGINKSGATTAIKNPNDAPVSGRYCDTIQEKFTEYDEQNMSFTYQMIDPPWVIRNIRNTWRVRSVEPNKSVIEMRPEIECHPLLGMLLKPLAKVFGGYVADRTFEEVAYYIEHDQPHPRKVKAQQKQMKVA